MSVSVDPHDVAKALDETGCAWVLKTTDGDALLRRAALEIDEFIKAHGERFPGEEPPDPFVLLQANPLKAAAFFQTFTGAPISTQMRVMVWELLFGAEIMAVAFNFDRHQTTELQVVLQSQRGTQEEYTSNQLWDFRIFRHIGLLAINDQPILDGYYARRD